MAQPLFFSEAAISSSVRAVSSFSCPFILKGPERNSSSLPSAHFTTTDVFVPPPSIPIRYCPFSSICQSPRSGQPFTAPTVTPSRKYFCRAKNRMNMGSADTVAPAIMGAK